MCTCKHHVVHRHYIMNHGTNRFSLDGFEFCGLPALFTCPKIDFYQQASQEKCMSLSLCFMSLSHHRIAHDCAKPIKASASFCTKKVANLLDFFVAALCMRLC